MAGGGSHGFKFTEQPQPVMSRGKFDRYARKYGLPAKAFWQITKGESGHKPFVQQHDPGDGMVGYGLFQLTPNAWGDGAAKQKFNQLGGIKGMRDVENQFKMARFLYKSAGKSFKPWYGTRFLTDRSGEGTLGPIRHNMQVGGGGGRKGNPRSGGQTVTSAGLNLNTAVQGIQGQLGSQIPQRSISAPQAPSFIAQTTLPEGQSMPTVAGSTGALVQGAGGSPLSELISNATSGDLVNPLINQALTGGRGQGGGGGRGGGRVNTGKVARAIQRADAFERKGFPYKWGGGHQTKLRKPKDFVPVDCSGAVSAVLKMDPRVSGQFESWGRAGDGGRKGITVYANDEHVLMKINGRFFGTSASNPGGGAGWIEAKPSKSYLSKFTARHVR